MKDDLFLIHHSSFRLHHFSMPLPMRVVRLFIRRLVVVRARLCVRGALRPFLARARPAQTLAAICDPASQFVLRMTLRGKRH
jgi:hypothetical protein